MRFNQRLTRSVYWFLAVPALVLGGIVTGGIVAPRPAAAVMSCENNSCQYFGRVEGSAMYFCNDGDEADGMECDATWRAVDGPLGPELQPDCRDRMCLQ